MDPKQPSEQRFALLIDADNVSAKYLKPIMDELSKYGTVTYKRIYGDWTLTLHAKWKDALLENSITPIQQFGYTQGKNATDSAMIIDAMDILYTHSVDGFCIVSSDSDFTRLASRIRESGLTVIGMGEKKTPVPFRKACDIFTTLELLLPQAGGAKGGGRGKERHDQGGQAASGQNTGPSIEEIERAVANIITDNLNNGKATGLGEVGSRLLKRYPDFDVRSYGTNQLKKLLDEFPGIIITKDGSSVTVELAEDKDAAKEAAGAGGAQGAEGAAAPAQPVDSGGGADAEKARGAEGARGGAEKPGAAEGAHGDADAADAGGKASGEAAQPAGDGGAQPAGGVADAGKEAASGGKGAGAKERGAEPRRSTRVAARARKAARPEDAAARSDAPAADAAAKDGGAATPPQAAGGLGDADAPEEARAQVPGDGGSAGAGDNRPGRARRRAVAERSRRAAAQGREGGADAPARASAAGAGAETAPEADAPQAPKPKRRRAKAAKSEAETPGAAEPAAEAAPEAPETPEAPRGRKARKAASETAPEADAPQAPKPKRRRAKAAQAGGEPAQAAQAAGARPAQAAGADPAPDAGVRAYVRQLVSEAGPGGVELSQLGKRVRARFRTFKLRDLGYSQFKGYVADVEGVALEQRDGALHAVSNS